MEKLLSVGWPLLAALPLAQEPGSAGAEHLQRLGWQLLSLWIFGLSGIAILYIGYWVFDKLTPGIHFTRELVEKDNRAVAIVLASVLIGVALIVAATMLG